MKKTQKMLAAVALSTTLVMGLAPAAFAADASAGEAGSFDATGTASTTMNVYTIGEDQIQATVPLAITVVTPVKGGAITAPSATAYKIVNNGSTDIKVTKIKGVDNGGWALKQTLEDASAITTTGQMKLGIKAGASSEVSILSTGEGTLSAEDAAHFVAEKNGGELGLALSGTTAVPTAGLTADKSYPAVKIQYTVEKVTAA